MRKDSIEEVWSQEGEYTVPTHVGHEQTLPKEDPRRVSYDHMLKDLTEFLSKDPNHEKSDEGLSQEWRDGSTNSHVLRTF